MTFSGTTVTWELNRLALGGTPTGALMDPARAANVWAGTTALDLDGALAAKAGTAKLTAIASANFLAGTTNLPLAEALSLIATGATSLFADAYSNTY